MSRADQRIRVRALRDVARRQAERERQRKAEPPKPPAVEVWFYRPHRHLGRPAAGGAS